MNPTFRTRIAPTPSGYLHLGNAWSFLYTWLWARSQGGIVFLRIDTMDADRLRPTYIEDIYTSLKWLGLDWDEEAELNRANELQTLKALIEQPIEVEKGWVYACHCSRDQIQKTIQAKGLPPGIYPGTCRHQKITSWVDGLAAPVLRWHCPPALSVRYHEERLGLQKVQPAEAIGDMVIRSRAGHIAYHLSSLVDDKTRGISHIVRGLDLQPSTAGQLALAKGMGYSEFADIRFLHHPLVLCNQVKLSKSAGAPSLKAMRESGLRPEVVWDFFAKSLNLPFKSGQSLQDLCTFFIPGQLPQSAPSFEEFRL